jgi:hypothetical protein
MTVSPMVQGAIMPHQCDQNDRHCVNGFHQNGEFAAFFVPLEVLPRTMTTSMVRFDCHGNPVNGHFCPNLTANATCANFDQLTA